MGLFQTVEKKMATFKWWEYSIFKTCMVAFTLMLAKLWSPILSLEWYWYGGIFAVTYLYILKRVFG